MIKGLHLSSDSKLRIVSSELIRFPQFSDTVSSAKTTVSSLHSLRTELSSALLIVTVGKAIFLEMFTAEHRLITAVQSFM